MASGGKGGSTTTSVQLPKFIEDAAAQSVDQAQRAAQIGFIPYTGPTVAAFTPQQEAAFASTQQAAGAFGLPTATGTGLPEPTTFAGGIQGYSPIPLYEQAVADLAATSPGQFDLINSFFIDPVTGAAPTGIPQVGVAPIQPISVFDGGEMGVVDTPNAGTGLGDLGGFLDGGLLGGIF